MVLILLIAMIGVPILEIIVFIEAGGYLGLWPTVGAVILTAIVGSALLRHQGLSTLARAQENMAAGKVPVTEVFDGLCILIGGALLLTPGFITDAVGFSLLIPPVRDILRRMASRHFANKANMHVWTDTPPDDDPRSQGQGPVIDGQFEEVDPADHKKPPEQPAPRNPHGWSKPPDRRPQPKIVPPDDP